MKVLGLFFTLLCILFLTACSYIPKPTNDADKAPVPPSAMVKAEDGIKPLTAELRNYIYPRDVETFELKTQKQTLTMAYVLAKPKNPNGRTALLLHGKNFSAPYWENTIQFLLDKGYQVLAPDQIGFGKSSKPENYQFSFQGLAQNTKALLDDLKIEKVSVVGHSMGGMLGTRFSLMYPNIVDKLILVNPIGLEDYKTLALPVSVDQLYQTELKATPDSIRNYQKNVYFDGKWKKEYEPLVQILAGWTQHEDYPKVAWNAALTADMIWNQPVVYELQLLKPKTLLIIGTRDRTALGRDRVPLSLREKMGRYDQLGKITAKKIPHSELLEIKDVGHMPQVEAFDTYKEAILRFL